MRIYLAGSVRDPWREAFRFRAPQHHYLDPSAHNHIFDEDVYTMLNLQMVRQSDLVVAYCAPSNPSLYGTSVEVGAAWGLGIPVLVIDALTPAEDWRAEHFGMHRSMSMTVVRDVDEAIEILQAMPGDNHDTPLFNGLRIA